jgi:hypothetical protein
VANSAKLAAALFGGFGNRVLLALLAGRSAGPMEAAGALTDAGWVRGPASVLEDLRARRRWSSGCAPHAVAGCETGPDAACDSERPRGVGAARVGAGGGDWGDSGLRGGDGGGWLLAFDGEGGGNGGGSCLGTDCDGVALGKLRRLASGADVAGAVVAGVSDKGRSEGPGPAAMTAARFVALSTERRARPTEPTLARESITARGSGRACGRPLGPSPSTPFEASKERTVGAADGSGEAERPRRR